ncbi:MAG: hypothetical protein J7K81_05600 [Methanophagales archaeon]|nr:hypothetical protein [Methanophagales archaeon]
MLTKAITYAGLNATFRKGQRNGNWRKLRFLDKVLYRASLWYAKRGRNIAMPSSWSCEPIDNAVILTYDSIACA